MRADPLDKLEQTLAKAGVKIVVTEDGQTKLVGRGVKTLTAKLLDAVREMKDAILERAGKSAPTIVAEAPKLHAGCDAAADGYWAGLHDAPLYRCERCRRQFCTRCSFMFDNKCPKCLGSIN